MSTNENTSADAESVDQDDNLDLFSEGFFGQKTETPAEAKAEETEDTVDPEADANEEDTHTEDDDTIDTDDESVDEASTPTPMKKNRFQARIVAVVGTHREAERKLEEAQIERETGRERGCQDG